MINHYIRGKEPFKVGQLVRNDGIMRDDSLFIVLEVRWLTESCRWMLLVLGQRSGISFHRHSYWFAPVVKTTA